MSILILFLVGGQTLGHGDDDLGDMSHDIGEHEYDADGESACIEDDGVTMADVDLPAGCRDEAAWASCPEWTCSGDLWSESLIGMAMGATDTTHNFSPTKDVGGHKCMNDDVTGLYPKSGYPDRYDADNLPGIPNSGYHRAKWPKYGEYKWVPPIRYIHALEHGAIVFVYHPCAPNALVDRLRAIATGCLWKHLIFPFKSGLDQKYPAALLSYGNVLKVSILWVWFDILSTTWFGLVSFFVSGKLPRGN